MDCAHWRLPWLPPHCCLGKAHARLEEILARQIRSKGRMRRLFKKKRELKNHIGISLRSLNRHSPLTQKGKMPHQPRIRQTNRNCGLNRISPKKSHRSQESLTSRSTATCRNSQIPISRHPRLSRTARWIHLEDAERHMLASAWT